MTAETGGKHLTYVISHGGLRPIWSVLCVGCQWRTPLFSEKDEAIKLARAHEQVFEEPTE